MRSTDRRRKSPCPPYFPSSSRNCFHVISLTFCSSSSFLISGSVKIRRSPSRRDALFVTADVVAHGPGRAETHVGKPGRAGKEDRRQYRVTGESRANQANPAERQDDGAKRSPHLEAVALRKIVGQLSADDRRHAAGQQDH